LFNPYFALGGKNPTSSVFASLKILVRNWAKPFYNFSYYGRAQNATIISPIGAQKIIVKHDVKHVRITLKLAKFFARVE